MTLYGKSGLVRLVSDAVHSVEFVNDYYGGESAVADCLAHHADHMLPYGKEADEHAGDQFYNENIRRLAMIYATGLL